MYTRGKFKFVDPIALLFKFRKIAGEENQIIPWIAFFLIVCTNGVSDWGF